LQGKRAGLRCGHPSDRVELQSLRRAASYRRSEHENGTHDACTATEHRRDWKQTRKMHGGVGSTRIVSIR
jgi:hypothetical protein